jgi:hypothetical protein
MDLKDDMYFEAKVKVKLSRCFNLASRHEGVSRDWS